ncbi:hypothetical protein BC834DRAFT_1039218 [Gloeopeniophorella convolvens]|nr:hypothetical protein BC834DRAFT_1039218 [Gloeopeniophorella convolvens]
MSDDEPDSYVHFVDSSRDVFWWTLEGVKGPVIISSVSRWKELISGILHWHGRLKVSLEERAGLSETDAYKLFDGVVITDSASWAQLNANLRGLYASSVPKGQKIPPVIKLGTLSVDLMK